MKKIIALVIVLVSVIGLFSSCAVKPGSQYEAYETFAIGGFNSIGTISEEIFYMNEGLNEEDYVKLTGNYSKSNTEKRTVEFKGKEYTGTYSQAKGVISQFPIRAYKDIVSFAFDGGNFLVRYHTGEFAGISFDINDLGKKYEIGDPAEYLDIAKEYASDYIIVDDYNINLNVWKPSEDSIGRYYYVFTKVIEGYETTDSLFVVLSPEGEFISLAMNDIKAFDKMNISVDKEKVDESLKNKIETLFTEKGYENITYSLYDETHRPMILKTKDGDVAVYSEYLIEVMKDGKNMTIPNAFLTFVEVK